MSSSRSFVDMDCVGVLSTWPHMVEADVEEPNAKVPRYIPSTVSASGQIRSSSSDVKYRLKQKIQQKKKLKAAQQMSSQMAVESDQYVSSQNLASPMSDVSECYDNSCMLSPPPVGPLQSPMSVCDESIYPPSQAELDPEHPFADFANSIKPGHSIEDDANCMQSGMKEMSRNPVMTTPDWEGIDFSFSSAPAQMSTPMTESDAAVQAIMHSIQTLNDPKKDLFSETNAVTSDFEILDTDEAPVSQDSHMLDEFLDLYMEGKEKSVETPSKLAARPAPNNGESLFDQIGFGAPMEQGHVTDTFNKFKRHMYASGGEMRLLSPPLQPFTMDRAPQTPIPQYMHNMAPATPPPQSQPQTDYIAKVRYQGKIHPYTVRVGCQVEHIKKKLKEDGIIKEEFFLTDRNFACLDDYSELPFLTGGGEILLNVTEVTKEKKRRPVPRRN